MTTSAKLGLCIMYPAPGVIERLGRDWDWIWLDGQHGQIAGYDTMLAMVRACNLAQTLAYVRVPGQEPSAISLALDMGADAVIVPQIDTVPQALAAVQAAKFPPLGNRSFGGRRPIDREGRSYVDTSNQQTKLICQIESPTAVANAEAIAALPGVDGLFLGPDDLALRLEGSESDKKEKLQAAIHEIAHVCRRHGKDSICVGASAETAALCLSAGITHIVGGGDVGFLAEGSANALKRFRETLAQTSPSQAGAALY